MLLSAVACSLLFHVNAEYTVQYVCQLDSDIELPGLLLGPRSWGNVDRNFWRKPRQLATVVGRYGSPSALLASTTKRASHRFSSRALKEA